MTHTFTRTYTLPEVIVGGRATGKTHQLLLALLDDDEGLMLTHGVVACEHVRDSYEKLLRERHKDWSNDHIKVRVMNQIVAAGHVPIMNHKGNLYIDNFIEVLAAILKRGPLDIRMVAGNVSARTSQGKRFETDQPNPYL